MRLTLVRHAQAAPGTATDSDGPMLSEHGRLQAQRLGERFADVHFDHIYSSDLNRARDTATAILGCHTEVPYSALPELREVMTEHLRGDVPDDPVRRERMVAELDDLSRFIRRLFSDHPPGAELLLIIHGNLIRLLIATLAQIPPERSVMMHIHNTSVTILQVYRNFSPVLELVNCTRHLHRDDVT